MRFFYLFTSAAATAVVSNAAVLPRWSNPSIRYSDHAPATSMVNIASESHPPILAIQGYSGTLVSLMRRTPQVESTGGDGSGSESGPGLGPGSGSGSGSGPGPESESSTSSSSESGPDPIPSPGPRTQSGLDLSPSPRPRAKSLSGLGSGSKFNFGPRPDPSPSPSSESESELSPSPRPRSKSLSDLGSGSDFDFGPRPDPSPSPRPRSKSLSDLGSRLGSESESELSPSPRPRSKSLSDLGSGSDFDFGPRPGSGPESETQVEASSSSSFLTRTRNRFTGFFKAIQRLTQRLTYALKKLIRKHTGPSREVKAAGKAVGGALGPPLVQYFAKSQKGVESIRDWLKGMGPSLRSLIKKSLGKNQYAKVKGSLKMAFNDASNDVKRYLEELKVTLRTMKRGDEALRDLVETSHRNLMGVLPVYQKLLVSLEPYMEGDAKGKRAAELLSEAKDLIASFVDVQQSRYDAIMKILERLPKDYVGDQFSSNKPSAMQKAKTFFGKKSSQ